MQHVRDTGERVQKKAGAHTHNTQAEREYEKCKKALAGLRFAFAMQSNMER